MKSKSGYMLRHVRVSKKRTLVPAAMRAYPAAMRQRIMAAVADQVLDAHERVLRQGMNIQVVGPSVEQLMADLTSRIEGVELTDTYGPEPTKH